MRPMSKESNRKKLRENVSETEALLLQRMKETLEQSGMNKSKYAENLGWGLSKLSRVLSGETSLSVANGVDMARALGYPLEAFLQPEFDLEKYDQTHSKGTMTIRECIVKSLCWMDGGDDFKECVLRQFPRTIRQTLEVGSEQFLVSGELNEKKTNFVSVNDTIETGYSFLPQVTLRYKGISSKNNDILAVGYWFSETRNYVSLSICYIPDRDTFSTYGVNKRAYYKSLIDDKEILNQDMQNLSFTDELSAGEICSKIYDLETSKMDEETLIKDLKYFFETYQRLVQETINTVDTTFWRAYNEFMTENGPKTEISAEGISRKFVSMLGTYKQNPKIRAAALAKANGICEICGTDKTFTDKKGGQYFETHYLVPLKYASDNENCNQIANIICLCPNCHRKIQYANDSEREEILVDLYYKRKNELEEAGINISLAKLLKMYQIE